MRSLLMLKGAKHKQSSKGIACGDPAVAPVCAEHPVGVHTMDR
jgi:hypothetical protein